ncbi:MAG TPA: DUF4270 family protein, partial [Chitinophagales bacterium]|nr:DUF4270 family protein [Chitinophagales bacterium]
SFYAQCAPTITGASLGYYPVLDSVVLSLAYNGQYGPCTAPVNISVYELNQDLDYSTTYYTTSSAQVKTPAIGQLNGFVPDFYDSVVLGSGVAIAPNLHIRLSDDFGNRLLHADSTIWYDDSSFYTFMKGIYVTSTSASTGNGMMYMNLSSGISGITLYYHTYYSTDTVGQVVYYEALQLSFPGAVFNHFDNLYNSTAAQAAVLAGNSSNNADKVYMQGGGGVRGKLVIAGLDTLSRKTGINKAELVVTQSVADTQFAAPTDLNLLRIDDAGNGQALEDAYTTNYGGTRTTETVNGATVTRYRFNITRYFQKLVQGVYNNNGLILQVPSGYVAADRLVLTNPVNDKNYRILLVVTYTKL